MILTPYIFFPKLSKVYVMVLSAFSSMLAFKKQCCLRSKEGRSVILLAAEPNNLCLLTTTIF